MIVDTSPMLSEPVWPSFDIFVAKSGTESPFERCKYIVCKKCIGNGSYSYIFECKNVITGCHYAAKRYSKKLMYGMESMLQHEFIVLKSISMNHPNILNLIDYFETEEYLYLVTDLAKGDLYDRIVNNSKLEEAKVKEITYNLVATLEYLHEHNIIHRDIKAENILFQDKDLSNTLLADFGLARILNPGELLFERSGTLSYMAPETLQRIGYTFPVDIWALGVTVYFMLCGYLPFDCENDEETMEAIKSADYIFEPEEYWNHISADAKDFLLCCFRVDPHTRYTAAQLLTHPFINSLSVAECLSNLPSSAASIAIMKSRKNSTISGVTSHGALCDAPEFVSKFSTPIMSREQSVENLTRFNINWNDKS